MNYYHLLQISPQATPQEIKSAFRRRIKELHPDLRKDRSPDGVEVHHLIEAYEVLSNLDSREAYDRTLGPSAPPRSTFNYREWLAERDDPESRAKLIFYDAIRNRTKDAADLFLKMQEAPSFSLEGILGKEDFMDCGFMLALEFEASNDLPQAVFLLWRLAQLEGGKPYFRHFFVEVEERLQNLLCRRITNEIESTRLIALLEESQTLPFRPRIKVAFLKRLAKTYGGMGQGLLARQTLDKALELTPQDQTLKKIARELGV